MKRCPECGKRAVGSPRRIYCSERCRQRRNKRLYIDRHRATFRAYQAEWRRDHYVPTGTPRGKPPRDERGFAPAWAIWVGR